MREFEVVVAVVIGVVVEKWEMFVAWKDYFRDSCHKVRVVKKVCVSIGGVV